MGSATMRSNNKTVISDLQIGVRARVFRTEHAKRAENFRSAAAQNIKLIVGLLLPSEGRHCEIIKLLNITKVTGLKLRHNVDTSVKY